MTSLSQPQTPPLYTPRAKNFALVLLAMTQFVIVSTPRSSTSRCHRSALTCTSRALTCPGS